MSERGKPVGFTQENRRLTIETKLGKDKLLVRNMEGHEGLSEQFHYWLELQSEDDTLAFDKVVNTLATVSILEEGDKIRYINGVVTRFAYSHREQHVTTYRMELKPWLWMLDIAADCRIFQEQTATEIIEAVFKDFDQNCYKLDVKTAPAKRVYCVQYKETALNFVNRLMEEEGIFYYFVHTADKHEMVLADATTTHPKCLLFEPQFDYTGVSKSDEDVLPRVRIEERVIPKTYSMGDYDYTKPATALAAKADSTKKVTGKTEIYEFHGNYDVVKAGETRAGRRLEAYEVTQRVMNGVSGTRTFTAGYKFKLGDHPREEFNGEYVLRRLELTVDQSQYRNKFEAFPAAVPFRPSQAAIKPRMTATETAEVVGKAGEEIFADSDARIKVQFHWDRVGKKDEKSTCWIRVAQLWAGKAWGGLWIPRIGQEVIIQYIDGDPDRPVVTGALYNGTHKPPYDPSKEPTVSTIKSDSSKGGGGFNEIKFDDKKDSELIEVHAQKDMKIKVEHDRIKEVLNDETNTITKNRLTTIKEENETLHVDKGNREILVKTGDEKHEVKGKRDLKVTGDEKHVNEANFTQEVKGDYTLKVTGNLLLDVTGTVTIKSKGDMTHDSKGALTNKAAMDVKTEGLNVANKAKAKFSGEGAMAEVKASGILTLKGSMTNIN